MSRFQDFKEKGKNESKKPGQKRPTHANTNRKHNFNPILGWFQASL
jgi:hypothetical protein